MHKTLLQNQLCSQLCHSHHHHPHLHPHHPHPLHYIPHHHHFLSSLSPGAAAATPYSSSAMPNSKKSKSSVANAAAVTKTTAAAAKAAAAAHIMATSSSSSTSPPPPAGGCIGVSRPSSTSSSPSRRPRPSTPQQAPPYPFNLGHHHRPVRTSNPLAQRWFDRGLIWSYAFNHEESAMCFTHAITLDPSCPMAYWGVAYALGPNYNKPWESYDEKELATTLARVRTALKSTEKLQIEAGVEKALIAAIRFRYLEVNDVGVGNVRYADAMKVVYERYPNDLDVATLYADAMMNLTPWKLWNIHTGQPAENAKTMEIKRVLETALAQQGGLKHPGVLHLYIHLMEMSGTPEKALTVADNLRGLVPDAGHLEHMPSHLDVLCGDYRKAVQANSSAILADDKYFHYYTGTKTCFYTLYRSHDYHFRIYAAMFSGQSRIALDTVSMLEKCLSEELLRIETPPMADWLEGFAGMRVHVYIRFGLWEEILSMPLPVDTELYSVTTALMYYARGLAYAATGNVEASLVERELFRAAALKVPESRTLFNNTCHDILCIASAMLDGEIEYRRQNYELAWENLRKAIDLDDHLPYDEPWGWMQPTRHAYGALLLEQGNVEEAAGVYRADLGFDDTLPRPQRHPNNVWSLHGYHECLVRMGKEGEAGILEHSLRMALAVADVEIRASCACRRSCCS